MPRLIGQDPRNSRREQAVTRQDRGRRRVGPGPAGDSCWSPPLWQSHWARARLHDGRDRHVRIHPIHPDHWAGTPGWDRLCHPKVTALIPFRVSAAPPGRPAPRADERGRPGWARPVTGASWRLTIGSPCAGMQAFYRSARSASDSHTVCPAVIARGRICLYKIIQPARPARFVENPRFRPGLGG